VIAALVLLVSLGGLFMAFTGLLASIVGLMLITRIGVLMLKWAMGGLALLAFMATLSWLIAGG